MLLIANPPVTVYLKMFVILESSKRKSLMQTIQKLLVKSSRQVIEAVESQKGGFDAITESLKVISKE